MNSESLKEAVRRELPHWLREAPDLRAYILELTRKEYAGRAEAETQDRSYEILAELRRDLEEQVHKWEEHHREWKEWTQWQSRKWEEHQAQHKEEIGTGAESVPARLSSPRYFGAIPIH